MPHHLRKAEAERVIRARLDAATVLRPAAYQQNLSARPLAGRMEVPYSLDAPFTNVDLDDVAEVAALVLTEDGHAGETYELAGPERLSVREMAAQASEVLGRPVEAVAVPLRASGSPAPARPCRTRPGRTSSRCSAATTGTGWSATRAPCGGCSAGSRALARGPPDAAPGHHPLGIGPRAVSMGG